MIRHIVMVKLKPETKPASVEKLKSMLEALPPLISEIKFYEVGVNVIESPAASDIVLVSEFNNKEELVAYREHPEHVKVLDYLKEVKESSTVVDYEF
mgnify:CR=1 FL=1